MECSNGGSRQQETEKMNFQNFGIPRSHFVRGFGIWRFSFRLFVCTYTTHVLRSVYFYLRRHVFEVLKVGESRFWLNQTRNFILIFGNSGSISVGAYIHSWPMLNRTSSPKDLKNYLNGKSSLKGTRHHNQASRLLSSKICLRIRLQRSTKFCSTPDGLLRGMRSKLISRIVSWIQ